MEHLVMSWLLDAAGVITQFFNWFQIVREAACKKFGQPYRSTLQANSNIAINEVNYIFFQNQDVGSAHLTDNTLK